MSLGPWITAGFDSDCDGCGAFIAEGEDIRADGEGGWLCQMCGYAESAESSDQAERDRYGTEKAADMPMPDAVTGEHETQGGNMVFEGVAGATIVLQLTDGSIEQIADRILGKLMSGLSPEAIERLNKNFPARDEHPGGMDEFAPRGGGEPEDPWAEPDGGSDAEPQQPARSAARGSQRSGSSARPASRPSASSGSPDSVTTNNGWVYSFDTPNAPNCQCGEPAARVKATGRNGPYEVYLCAKSAGEAAGYDWRDKCDLRKFVGTKGGRR